MKWTDKIPKKEGWYWCLQSDLLNATPEVVKVKVIKWEDKQKPEVWFIDQGTMKKHVIKQYDPLLWYGPLKVPAWRSIMKMLKGE